MTKSQTKKSVNDEGRNNQDNMASIAENELEDAPTEKNPQKQTISSERMAKEGEPL
jgi:hypothetical protein